MRKWKNLQVKYLDQTLADPVELSVSTGPPRPKIRKGMNMEFKDNHDRWIPGKILGRAGKATGKYRSNWNFENLNDKLISELNFDELNEWRELPIEEDVKDISISYDLSSV